MSASSSIHVAVRVRPFTIREAAQITRNTDDSPIFCGDGSLAGRSAPKLHGKGIRRVVKVIDDHMLVFDPAEDNPVAKYQKTILPQGKRVKDMRFGFDRVFDENCSQQDVYEATTRQLLDSVLDGFNATVFAYGATGCGKTHTISGTPQQPGIIFLTCAELFERIRELREEKDIELTLSYLEIYNETIRDLLIPGGSKLGLQLREDTNQNIAVAGLSTHKPKTVEEVMDMIVMGNANRTMSPTEANATSSRSHAVLQINISQKPRTAGISEAHVAATLSIIDLAGSERASVTKNRGERLLEGANINRSLLALGNCINALCDPAKKNHVPYRDSKLTRLLKFSLGGNCKTVMIVCVSPASIHYDETHNTLKYANRAKNIKTKVSRNMINVNRHVSQYVKAIYDLRQEVDELKKKVTEATNAAVEKLRKQEVAKVNSLQEGLRRVRASFEHSRLEREEHIRDIRNLRLVTQRVTIITAWLTAFNEVFTDDSAMPPHLLELHTEARKLLREMEATKIAIQQKISAPTWESIIDSALQNSLRSLQNIESTTQMDKNYLTCEANLMRMQGERDILQALAETEIDVSSNLQALSKSHFEALAALHTLTTSDLEDDMGLQSLQTSLATTQTGITQAVGKLVAPHTDLSSLASYPAPTILRPTSAPSPFKPRPSGLPVSPRRLSVAPSQLPVPSPSKPSPRPHKVRTPKKAVKFPKSPGKKRVRFLDHDSPGASSPAPAQPVFTKPDDTALNAPPIRPKTSSRFDPNFLAKPKDSTTTHPPEPLQLSPTAALNRRPVSSRPPVRKSSGHHPYPAPKRRSPSSSSNTSPSASASVHIGPAARRMVAAGKDLGGSFSTVLSPRGSGVAGIKKEQPHKENRRMTVAGAGGLGGLNLSSLALQGLREQLKGIDESVLTGAAGAAGAGGKPVWR